MSEYGVDEALEAITLATCKAQRVGLSADTLGHLLAAKASALRDVDAAAEQARGEIRRDPGQLAPVKTERRVDKRLGGR